MRLSNFLLPTLKEIPSEAKIKSHILMIKAGMIKKASSGLYYYLPLGMRVLNKVINIVREEMNNIGALEILAPILIPNDLIIQSGRAEVFGNTMMSFADRHNKIYALGPTHEESITNLVLSDIKSYKDLPLLLYQINTKFRDEIRPRFGVLRTREFIMKDAYSFHATSESLDEVYKTMAYAYNKIFKRCGLSVVPVDALSGSMGGSDSMEFMVKSEVGEEVIMHCTECGYAANLETAYSKLNNSHNQLDQALKELDIVDTPNQKTIEEITSFLNVSPASCIKSLVYKKSDGEFIMVLARGDSQINEVKLTSQLNTQEIVLPSQDEIKEKFGLDIGFLGPVNLQHDIKIIADNSIATMSSGVCGANLKDKHYVNVSVKRDINISEFYDIRLVNEGDPCPLCEKALAAFKGIEIGHIFKLGTKYSKASNLLFRDKDSSQKHPTMGSYGIGINRIPATIIENSASDNSIVWPCSIAPFHVIIIPINFKSDKQMQLANDLYSKLLKENIDALLDDRKISVGVKFKDADLIGVPFRIIVGDKELSKSFVEFKNRLTDSVSTIPINQVVLKVKELVDNECNI